ncbi:SipW-dependent-type signal peptide-containing protein [Brachybacterium sp. YJGR34]|uniref:SipW-dependent-type signal peptide-containing protein n=1 Tax=Brachybacterium sp. YJGR34 TaxID=2059911 RepID=UPI000E0C40DB|nr:SipW-dependent-type signal peptide-containing protein [Brachybacterium sp. YJGR34]
MTGRRGARALGLLAGGLALGVAGSLTVASWQDSEAAATTFVAGTFETQSQGAGGDWAHHAPGSAASLSADLSDLAPGGTWDAPTAGASHYGALNVRTARGSTRGGEVLLEGVTAEGALADAVEYRVVARSASSAPCTAADFGPDARYLAGGPDSYVDLGAPLDATSAEVGADGADPLGLCLDLRAAAPTTGATGAEVQGTSARIDLTLTVTQL